MRGKKNDNCETSNNFVLERMEMVKNPNYETQVFDFIFNIHSGNQKFENFGIKKNIRVENLVRLENSPIRNQRSLELRT